MKAIILAAGEGKRMRPLTLKTPKPLLRIDNKPIIEYVFDALPPEVDEVIMVVRYLGDQIKKYLGQKYRGRKIYFTEGSEKGTACSFLSAKPFIKDERFLFLYGDEIPNPQDVKNCLTKELAVIVFESQNPAAHGIVARRADGSIVEVVEKPSRSKSNLAVDGVMVLNDKIFNYQPRLNASGEYYFTSLLDQFVKDFKVWAVAADGFVGDVTTPADLKRVAKILGVD